MRYYYLLPSLLVGCCWPLRSNLRIPLFFLDLFSDIPSFSATSVYLYPSSLLLSDNITIEKSVLGEVIHRQNVVGRNEVNNAIHSAYNADNAYRPSLFASTTRNPGMIHHKERVFHFLY